MLPYMLMKNYLVTLAILILCFTNIYGESSSYSDTSKINSILNKAKVALDSNKLFESFRLSKSALDKSISIDYTLGKAKSLYNIGQIQSLNGRKDSSIVTLKKALVLFNTAGDEFSIGNTLNRIGNIFLDVSNLDSAEYYYNKALTIRQKIGDKKGIAGSINNLGLIYNERGIYSKALEYYFLSLSVREEIVDKSSLPILYNNIGIVFWNQSNYAKALDYFFKSLKIKEELNDLKGSAFIYNNIGLVYQQSGDLAMALKYHNESLRLKESQGDRTGMSYSYTSLGDVYLLQKDYQKALEAYSKAEVIIKEQSNYLSLATLYINIGKLEREQGNLNLSLKFLLKADSLFNKLDNPKGSANSLIQISITQFKLGLKRDAINNCTRGISLAKQIGLLEYIKQGYENLYQIYESLGETTFAFNSYKTFIFFRDSLNNIEKSKEIIKVQMQGEFDQLLQKQKAEQDLKLAIAQGKSHKQTIVANIFIFAFILTLAILTLFFLNFRQKQKHNDLLAFQKLDMERQRSELINQRDELEIQKNLVIHQRDRIMTMLTDLGESIDYARKIQQALLPSDKALEILLNDYFLLFQPRESVGGDFYWVAQKDHLTFFAIADCTGHGVPGGFMSMLGVSLLNELIARPDCSSPAKILWNLRDMIIKALNQTGQDEDSQDGMDIALCMYNSQNHHLVYSGANLSLIISTSTPPPASDKVYVQDNIVELKPDRMPVAFYQRMENFYEHHIVLNPGDSIYLFSDGYSDQFGGPMNKKFGYITFRNLIATTAKKPFERQKNIFWNEFDKWKGVENQTDDVIVMGVKIS